MGGGIAGNTNKQIHPDQFTISLSIHRDSQTNPEQEKITQRIESIFYFNSGYPTLDLIKKQVIEYSIIAAIVLIFILAIASSIMLSQINDLN